MIFAERAETSGGLRREDAARGARDGLGPNITAALIAFVGLVMLGVPRDDRRGVGSL